MSAEHRRPMVAFVAISVIAAMIVANALRGDAVVSLLREQIRAAIVQGAITLPLPEVAERSLLAQDELDGQLLRPALPAPEAGAAEVLEAETSTSTPSSGDDEPASRAVDGARQGAGRNDGGPARERGDRPPGKSHLGWSPGPSTGSPGHGPARDRGPAAGGPGRAGDADGPGRSGQAPGQDKSKPKAKGKSKGKGKAKGRSKARAAGRDDDRDRGSDRGERGRDRAEERGGRDRDRADRDRGRSKAAGAPGRGSSKPGKSKPGKGKGKSRGKGRSRR